MPYRRIACCVEPSGAPHRVVAGASWIGRGAGALDVLHVAPPAEVMRGGLTAWEVPAESAGAHEEPRRWLESVAGAHRGARPVLLVARAPEEGILRWAEEQAVDLLVCAAGSETAVRRAVLGSVAGALAAGAPCPVLVLPPEDSADLPSAPPQRIACCIDGSEGARVAIREAGRVRDALGADLAMVHVASPPLRAPRPLPRRLIARLVPLPPRSRRDARALVDRAAREAGAEPILLDGYPSEAVIRWADDWGADLLVAGRAARPAAGAVLGSFVRETLRKAPCPVLVAAARD